MLHVRVVCKSTPGTSGVLAVSELGGGSFRSNHCSRDWPMTPHPIVCSLLNRVENTCNMSTKTHILQYQCTTLVVRVSMGGAEAGSIFAFQMVKCA